MKRKFPAILFSLPQVATLSLPPRAETLARIESGELDHLDFSALVFNTSQNSNFVTFPADSLAGFAASFEAHPFLRNHDQWDIAARDGTILESVLCTAQSGAGSSGEVEGHVLDGNAFRQTIRLTTRRGMTDFLEGRIDRFSIGWWYTDILCTICNSSIYGCSHIPGQKYKSTPQGHGQLCQLLFTEPRAKETSAVNVAAVSGTGIEALLAFQSLYSPSLLGKGQGLGSLGKDGDSDPISQLAVPSLSQVSPEQPVPVGDSRREPHNRLSQKGVHSMKKKIKRNGAVLEVEENEVLETDHELTPQEAVLEANRQASAELLGETRRMQDLQAQIDQSNQILISQCGLLLQSGLAGSNLPELTQARIRKTFAGRMFEAPELTAAIQEAKDEVAALTAGQVVRGPGRVTSMYTGGDQLTLAVEDLLGVERLPENKAVKIARLSGIREAYISLTGDREFTGGFFPEGILGDTATFPVIVKNALNKRLENAWAKYGAAGYDWWKYITSVEHFESLQQIDWLITGTIGSLPTVAEKGEYTELPIGDNGETSDWAKYGGYVGLTLEAILRDDVRAFKRLPDELAMGGIRNISEQVAAIFTANAGVGPTLSDTGALFNNTAQTTKGGHKNLLTTAIGTDYVAWRAVVAAMYSQPMHVQNATGKYGTGKAQAVTPKYCLVPQALAGAAFDLFKKDWNASGPILDYGVVEPLVVPDWTDATDWAAVADPNILPGIMLGEIFGLKPQIYLAGNESDPAMFANDESRLKVRQFLTVGIANWRALHKENVGG